MEIYKQHPRYTTYEISDKGNIRNIKTKRVLKTRVSGKSRYPKVNIRLDKKQITRQVHRLVAEAFYGEIPEGMVVDHIDRDRTNSNKSNLRIVSSPKNNTNRILISEKIPHIIYNQLEKVFQVNGVKIKNKKEALTLFKKSI